jgi:hypothetical protein
MTSEAEFQAALTRALNAPTRSTRVWRVNAGDVLVETERGKRRIRGARKGAADLCGFVSPHGLHLEVECKRWGGRLSPAQLRHGRVLRAAGCVWVVVYGPREGERLEDAVRAALSAIDLEIHQALR